MRRFALILAACLYGCNTGARQPPSQPAVASSTRPILTSVELQYGIYLARLDVRITVSPDGLLRSVRTDNMSYGGNDIDPKYERVEIREGKLTAGQMADLAHLFVDWDSLSSQPSAGAPDGGEVKVRYGDKTVSGGSDVPKQVTDVRVRLSELAQSMPVVKP